MELNPTMELIFSIGVQKKKKIIRSIEVGLQLDSYTWETWDMVVKYLTVKPGVIPSHDSLWGGEQDDTNRFVSNNCGKWEQPMLAVRSHGPYVRLMTK